MLLCFCASAVKDIIIRGGENIHSTEVENALYADARVHDAAAVSVPDPRLGELVAAVVSVKPQYASTTTSSSDEGGGGRVMVTVTEKSVIEGVRKLYVFCFVLFSSLLFSFLFVYRI